MDPITINTSFLRGRKKPRGFVYQVYLAMKPYLGGYRGVPTYSRVEAIVIRSKDKSKRVEDLLIHRRRVDIVRQCLQLMEESVFKSEEIAYERYPQLDVDNDKYEDLDEDCSDEDYMIPPTKFEPGRKPFELELVQENIQPPRASRLDGYIEPLSSIKVAGIRKGAINENRPPHGSSGALPENPSAPENPIVSPKTIALPMITQTTLLTRLEWIMQMTCFEFMNLYDHDLLYNERIHYADRATVRYYAILICHTEELPVDAILGDILSTSNPRPSLEKLVYPLLQLNSEKRSTESVSLETFYKYIEFCHDIARALRSDRTKKLKQLKEVVRLLFEGLSKDLEKQRDTVNYIVKHSFENARQGALKEPDKKKRAAKLTATNKDEEKALSDGDEQVKARHTFDKYVNILRFLDKEDEISSISGSTMVNPTKRIRNLTKALNIVSLDEEYIDSAADSD
ncbi:hypothetical protein ABW20_dc0104197 [Dactylellina cionopaga]|nr:hypothetical protein ABW20_dc0104197 [Dactylellina cionopaga]